MIARRNREVSSFYGGFFGNPGRGRPNLGRTGKIDENVQKKTEIEGCHRLAGMDGPGTGFAVWVLFVWVSVGDRAQTSRGF